MRKEKIIVFVLFLVVFAHISAQDLLTKEEAILQTLENNYDIILTENSLETARNNASVYNSGYLPTLFTNANASYDLNDSEATQISGDVVSTSSLESKNLSASVGFNYTLFNGLGRYYTYGKLKETYNLTELQARAVLENTLITLFSAYYEVARLTENLDNQKQTLEISKERLKRATYGSDYGQNTKLDVLNAEVDLNNDSITYLGVQRELANAKRDLNIVLGTDVNKEVSVDTTIVYLDDMYLEYVLEKSLENNVDYLQAKKALELGEYDVKINNSGWMPNVSLTSSYAWSKNYSDPFNPDNPFSTVERYQNGLNAGVGLTWNLFDGGNTTTRVRNAKIAVDRLETQKEQQEEFLKRDVNNAWEIYQNALFTLKVQKVNVETNKLNFERSTEYYKLGQISSIDFRLAQVNLVNAELTYSAAKYSAKTAELVLLQLAGDIIANKQF
ncbi:TolC family protein [Flavicella marina]|uniref:TolC family protein n=1 Tax=Flavicella marina TaxID=1475951 RepID=UPI0012654B05|nr:TolC family protein [Flavicella marina]